MVLLEGIELSTSPLPRECSTTELQQRRGVSGAVHLDFYRFRCKSADQRPPGRADEQGRNEASALISGVKAERRRAKISTGKVAAIAAEEERADEIVEAGQPSQQGDDGKGRDQPSNMDG